MAESLAELLRSFRSAARLSQEVLAESAGVSTRTVGDIETGFARSPRLVTVMLLAEALGLDEADRARLQAAARKPARKATESVARPSTLRPISLIGRDDDVATLSALVADPAIRLVTVCGPAGVGKTSLAVRVASTLADRFPGGAVLVELAPVTDPALIAATVARAVGVRETGDAATKNALRSALAARDMLLVLDNLEQLRPAAVWIGELVDACPGLTVLATSREPLRLRTERVYALRPLAAAAAAQLFVERAQAVKPGFALTGAHGAAVATIVERLEGLPLAIELAAPRLRLLPAKALAARLDRRLPFLDDGAVDLPERQQTMRGAIAWSYDLLAPDEQQLFRQLGVLHGGGSLEAARVIAGGAEPHGSAFLLRLAALVDKSLLTLEEDSDGEPHVAMLEMLREYAVEQLVETGELDAARRRHARHFADLAHADVALSAERQALWFDRMEQAQPNIRAAFQWALDAGEAAFGLDLATAVLRLWQQRGHLAEGRDWIRRLLDAASDDASVSDTLRARALRALVVLLSALGNFDEAIAPCEHAIRLQRAAGDERGLAASLTSLGIIRQFRGDLDGARATHREALAIRRRIGDEVGVANSLSNLASSEFTAGDIESAEPLAEESVALYRRCGHAAGIASALGKLGLIALSKHDYERASRLLEECLRLQREVGNTMGTVYALANLASAEQRRGLRDDAWAKLHEALEILQEAPNAAAIAAILEAAASALNEGGEAGRAARLYGAADTLRATIGSPRFPSEQAGYEADLGATRAALGASSFSTEWQIGATMTLDRVFEDALAERSEIAQR